MIVYDKEQKEIVIPNGIGNIDLYNNGVEAGYNQGKIDGIDEQKSKLKSIIIVNNGRYINEDGYNKIDVYVPDFNGSYEEGYKQGQIDMESNARVLNVTENGVYRSKFSDDMPPIAYTVTGVYADGTEFHNYAELNGKVFNTKITATIDSRLELWYKGDYTLSDDAYNVIIGAGNNDNSNTFQVRYYNIFNNSLAVNLGNNDIVLDGWDETVWHHLIVSKAEGLWIDGEKKTDFSPTNTIDGEFFINGINYDVKLYDGGKRNANGYFGMIKIDDTIIIPTADGFLNTNTGELLEVVKDGGYTFRENDPIYGEGELYKTINVNVPDLNGSYDEGYAQGKTDGINEQKSKLESINITENGTYRKEDGYNEVVVNVADLNGSYEEGYEQGQADVVANARDIEVTENGQYGDGKTLYKTINVNVNVIPKINLQKEGIKLAYGTFAEVPEWVDFEGVTDMSYMFSECKNIKTIPQIDTSNVVNMEYMFNGCNNLQTIPLLNTSNVTSMDNMFQTCYKLQSIPQIDTSNVKNMIAMFNSCNNLTSIPALNAQSLKMPSYAGFFGFSDLPKLTDFGGFLNLKSSLTNDSNLKKLPNLTKESCLNILNGLYDFVGNGETPNSNQGHLKVAQSFIDKVGDEISIATNKGWVVSAG